MASCITPTFGNSTCPQVRLTVTQQSATETAATLSWILEYVAHGYPATTSVDKTYSVEIDGDTVKSGSFSINGISNTVTIASGTKVITKTTFAQSIVFTCSMAFNMNWGGTYGGTKTASGRISVTAKSSYKISYNANGGTGAPSAQTKWYGTNLILSSSKPVRNGYTFKGWATSSSGSVAYQPGATYTTNAAVTLYAVWESATYTITYNGNGGSGIPSSQTKTYGQTTTLSNVVPVRENYSFIGWGVSASSTTASYQPGGSYSANASVTLYAIWSTDHKLPRVNNLTVDRCTEDGTLSDDGTKAKVTFDWETDFVPTTVKIEWRIVTSSTRAGLITIPVEENQTSGSVTRNSADVNVDNEYVFTVTITDEIGTTMSSVRLGTTSYIMDIMPGGTGVSFGCAASRDGLAEFGYEPAIRSADGSRVVKFNKPTSTDELTKASMYYQALDSGAWGNQYRLLSTANTRFLLWEGTWASGSITVPNIDKFSVYVVYFTADLLECAIGIRTTAKSTDILVSGMSPSDNVLKLYAARLRLSNQTLTRVAPRVWTLTGTSITSANQVMTIYRIEGLI